MHFNRFSFGRFVTALAVILAASIPAAAAQGNRMVSQEPFARDSGWNDTYSQGALLYAANPHDLPIRIEGPPAIVATGVIDLGAGVNAWLVASLAVAVFAALGLAIIAIRRNVYLLSFRVRAADGR